MLSCPLSNKNGPDLFRDHFNHHDGGPLLGADDYNILIGWKPVYNLLHTVQ